MVSNESLFLLILLIEVVVVFIASRLGREWLFGTLVANFILAGIFAEKLVSVFGIVINAGNIFYACVFLATHFLIERHGKKEVWQTIWFGAGFALFFTLMSQFAIHYKGSSPGDEISSTSTILFLFLPRIILASVLAYAFAQYVNIAVFSWISERTHGKFLWLRSNGANIISQLVDSMLFFSIAFIDLPGTLLVQAILTGWLLKSFVVLSGTPFLYLDTYLERRKS